MKTPNPIKTLLFTAILATLMVGSGRAAIVPLNGDFETNTFVAPIPDDPFGPYSPTLGSSSIADWSWSESAAPYPTAVRLISQDIDGERAVGGKAASHGTYAVSLEGATSWISQTITLDAGQYQLSFDASYWLPAFTAVNPIYASLGGVNFSFNNSTNPFSPTQGYNTYTSDVFTVTTAGTYELKIAANNPAGGYSGATAVDSVRLRALNNGPILSNGNFEDSVYVNTGTQDYSPTLGRSDIADWAWSPTTWPDYTTAVRLLLTDLNGGLIPDGSTYAVSLEGATSWIKQSVTLNPGQYQLSFDAATPLLQYVAANPIYASLDGVNLSFNGSTDAFSPTLNYVRYTSDVFTVTTAGTYELKIAADNPAGGYSGSSAVANVVLETAPINYASWAAVNVGGQPANLSYNNDGVQNGIKFFMNAPPGFTANPALIGGAVTWTNGGNIPSSAYGTQFAVQTSSDLAVWRDVPGNAVNLSNTAAALTWRIPSVANGDMGSFVANLPSSWTVSVGALASAQSTTNSPFLNTFTNNNSSWLIDDGADQSGGASFSQAFSTDFNYGSVAVNFDFMVAQLTGGTWGIQFDGAGANLVTGSSSVHYRIDASGQFAINAGPGGGVITNILALEAGKWYNVRAVFSTTAVNDGSDNGAGFQSGTITPAGGAPVSWTNVPLLNTSLGFSRVLVRDRDSASAGDLLLDNIAVTPRGKQFIRLKVTPD